MKKTIILTAATLIIIGLVTLAQTVSYNGGWGWKENVTGSASQELRYEIRGAYSRTVKKENFQNAGYIRDFSPGYPVNWISDYISTAISATCNGKVRKAVSINDVLSAEQRSILNSVDIGSEITVDVSYKYQNPATGNMDMRAMHISMMVIPAEEAQYIGGYREMIKYLEENAMNEISKTVSGEFKHGLVKFTVNEEGGIINAQISRSSGNSKVDKLLLKAINNMPSWKPANDAKGNKVKQDFEFSMGNDGC
ncbi:MAG: energy transducer TonB [Bacteroidota bacterium]